MKRVNLSVHLEDNELFEQSVKESLVGYAKQVAREELEKELVKEIDRVATSKVNDLKNNSYYNQLASRIADALVHKLGNEFTLNNEQISKMVEEKVALHLDRKLSQGYNIEAIINSYISKTVANILLTKE